MMLVQSLGHNAYRIGIAEFKGRSYVSSSHWLWIDHLNYYHWADSRDEAVMYCALDTCVVMSMVSRAYSYTPSDEPRFWGSVVDYHTQLSHWRDPKRYFGEPEREE
jgi:hypothetical protein